MNLPPLDLSPAGPRCTDCGAAVSRDNGSHLPDGRWVHIGCPARGLPELGMLQALDDVDREIAAASAPDSLPALGDFPTDDDQDVPPPDDLPMFVSAEERSEWERDHEPEQVAEALAPPVADDVPEEEPAAGALLDLGEVRGWLNALREVYHAAGIAGQAETVREVVGLVDGARETFADVVEQGDKLRADLAAATLQIKVVEDNKAADDKEYSALVDSSNALRDRLDEAEGKLTEVDDRVKDCVAAVKHAQEVLEPLCEKLIEDRRLLLEKLGKTDLEWMAQGGVYFADLPSRVAEEITEKLQEAVAEAGDVEKPIA